MATPRPSIRSATESPVNGGGGHTVATETAFKSSHINDIGCWHETKRKKKKDRAEKKGMGPSNVSCALFGLDWAPA